MDLKHLQQINDTRAEKTLSEQRHKQVVTSTAQVSDTVLSATASLIRYLEGHTTKAMVVNLPKNIGTPDVTKVIKAISDLHDTVKAQLEETKQTRLLLTQILDKTK